MPETQATPATALGGAKFDRSRKFGIEMECYGAAPRIVAEELTRAGIECAVEGYNHNRRTHWKIVSDGSIQGAHPFELVSPPIKGDDGLTQIRKVCIVLNHLGVKVNRSTGLHVHHDAGDLDLDTLKAVVTFWWKYEDVIQFFIPPSRRNNFFCAPAVPRGGACGYSWSGGNDPVGGWRRAMDSIRDRDGLRRFQRNGDRYAAVNFDALWRHGTIEFRSHSGTTDSAKIIAWVALTQWMITRGKEKGCRTTARMVGRWAEKTMFFFRAIDWINLTDPVVIAAKNTLARRFKHFKEVPGNGNAVNRLDEDGRPRQIPAQAALPEDGEESPRRGL